jgi:hypothetical protein
MKSQSDTPDALSLFPVYRFNPAFDARQVMRYSQMNKFFATQAEVLCTLVHPLPCLL